MIEGRVRETGHRYVGGLYAVEIHVDRRSAAGLPFVDHQRVELTLEIGEEKAKIGLRATPSNAAVWICPDLDDAKGKRSTLAELLNRHQIEKNAMVYLAVSGQSIRIEKHP